MSATPLEILVKETRHAFIIAKSDGVLDSGEVIQIAVDLAQKIQKLANLSGSEKKALLLLTLKKGLDASGGLDTLPGFSNASLETKQAFEDQLLTAASTTIDMLVSAVQGKIQLANPKTWLSCIFPCLSALKMALPKDKLFLQEAATFAEKIVKTDTTETTIVEEIVAAVVEAPEIGASVLTTIPGTATAATAATTTAATTTAATGTAATGTAAVAAAVTVVTSAATAAKVVKK